jgi:hypothetical protein
MFEPGQLCEELSHLAGNLESLKQWANKIFEHLEVVGAVSGAIKDVRPNNSIGGSCASDQKCVVV